MMKEFTLDFPRIDTKDAVTEDVKGFDVKHIVIRSTSEGTTVTVRYEDEG